MIPPLLYLERYRNEGTRMYSPHAGYTEAESRYRPNGGEESLTIPAFLLPTSELNLYEADPTPSLLARYCRGNQTLFCVHPQLLDDDGSDPYLERILARPRAPDWIRGSPSSSTRTLYVVGAEPSHALKLHFPFRVSRYGRRMRDEVVEQAIAVSRELQRGIGSLDARFAYFREVLGITHKNLRPETLRGENWGFLVRELTPFPAQPEKRPLMPGFSLFGQDFFDSGKELLIFSLMGKRDPAGYLLNEIMLPIIRHWVTCFLEFGFLLEPHGQNVLLEITPDGSVGRLVHRDLNLGIDNRRRRALGLPVGGSNTYNQMESGEFASITYDKFMGGHFFDHLVASVQSRYPDLALADLRDPCKEEFLRLFPEHERYLPRTVQYFSEQRDRFGKPAFTDTGRSPDWRP
ncbi:MAG: IucA/IucC family protein [Gemmatimonadota bacterium]